MATWTIHDLAGHCGTVEADTAEQAIAALRAGGVADDGRTLTAREDHSAALERIEAAFGDYRCTHDNPCGGAAYHDEGEALPWRIADDQASERLRHG